MKVFVTGGSGFIGTALLPELLEAGHKIIALARSDSAAAKIKSIGSDIKILRGSLEDLSVLQEGAKEADGVVHLGFIHDFDNYDKSCDIDRKAISAILESIENTDKAFIDTMGSLTLPLGRLATEEDKAAGARGETESLVLDFAKKGVRAMSVRLAPTVHGKGDWAFIRSLFNSAKKTGQSSYIGEGTSVWPAVHRLDAAHLYRLVLESGRPGRAYHAIAEQGVKSSLIAKAIGDTLHIPTVSISKDKAEEDLGFLGSYFAMDNPVSSEKTQSELGWKPVNVGLLEDIQANYAD